MGVTDRVGGLCAPLCERVGVELLDVEYNGGVLRVTIDHPDGVGMDAIAVLTREVSRALDHEDPLPGRYTL
ncbi:MAG: ribosome maturation factor RimP, partial [Acidimicrobiaceae bacterium]|nr:ribosome maturation factor RimP [Acidimicrobiaceae bacterium]